MTVDDGEDEEKRAIKCWWPLPVFIALTPICLCAGVASSGAGHGDYISAKVLFPYTLLSTMLTGTMSDPMIGLAIFQFPIYGVALSMGNLKQRSLIVAACLFFLHATAVILCFLYLEGY